MCQLKAPGHVAQKTGSGPHQLPAHHWNLWQSKSDNPKLLNISSKRLVLGHNSSKQTINICDKQASQSKSLNMCPRTLAVGHNSSKHTIENCKKQMCQPKASEHIIQKIGSGTQLLQTNHRNLWQTSLPVQSTWTCVPEHWWWPITAPNRPSISDKQTWQLKASKHIIQKTGSGSMKALNQK